MCAEKIVKGLIDYEWIARLKIWVAEFHISCSCGAELHA